MSTSSKSNKGLYIIIVILLISTLGLGYLYLNTYSVAIKMHNDDKAEVFQSKKIIDSLTTLLNNMEEEQQLMSSVANPNTIKLTLRGAGAAAESGQDATVFWDKETKETYIVGNNLAEITDEKDYQLWAIVDEKPVDLGVVSKKGLKRITVMKNIESPQAFAITVEPKGGSQSPTLEQMVVAGNVE
ncbi:MAG: anti-sigma factor [Aureispira sp.]|nr:anti-sigma factor [Aureispira sp.]